MAGYTILYPIPGSVNGRSLVDPAFLQEDLEAATYETVARGSVTITGDDDKLLEVIWTLYQNDVGGQNIGLGGRKLRSCSVGDIIIITGRDGGRRPYIVAPVGFQQVDMTGVDWPEGAAKGEKARNEIVRSLKRALDLIERNSVELESSGCADLELITPALVDLSALKMAFESR